METVGVAARHWTIVTEMRHHGCPHEVLKSREYPYYENTWKLAVNVAQWVVVTASAGRHRCLARDSNSTSKGFHRTPELTGHRLYPGIPTKDRLMTTVLAGELHL